MDSFRIIGGNKLVGDVIASGSKNASFPILAATVLLSDPITLHNLPQIEDIRCFLAILKDLGAEIDYKGRNSVTIDPTNINKSVVSEFLGSKIRGSYYLLGALLARLGEATIPYPGGCDVGERPMDLHITALTKIGAQFDDNGKIVMGKLKNKLQDNTLIEFKFPSRGATINTILAASLLNNITTTLVNVNNSPETESLITFLSQSGVKIYRHGDNLVIQGKAKIKLDEYYIMPDKIEVATMIAAGLVTGGKVRVIGGILEHVKPFLDKLLEIGYEYQSEHNEICAWHPVAIKLKPVDIISGLTYPFIDADFEPILAVLLSTISGDALIEDAMNPKRHSQFIPQLNSMGARIDMITDSKAVIHGGTNFVPANVMCKEIRGGVAITLAALSSEGESHIGNINQIDRGYENLDIKLASLGANIQRIKLQAEFFLSAEDKNKHY
jgi:UDP-N-acetylglucosamine 1-carboxyvinyltransferase